MLDLTPVEREREREKNKYSENTKVVSPVVSILLNDVECISDSCNICIDHEVHVRRQNISRSEYTNDSHLYVPEEGIVVVAVDMQEVIMLPRMPGVKRLIFTKR